MTMEHAKNLLNNLLCAMKLAIVAFDAQGIGEVALSQVVKLKKRVWA